MPNQISASSDNLRRILEKWGTNYDVLNQILAHTIAIGEFHRNFDSKLLKPYANLNKLIESQKIFSQMPNPEVRAWTCLQKLYLDAKMPTKALRLFSDLILSDSAKPDSHSIVAALSACARIKDIKTGRIIHGMTYKYLQNPSPNVDNALMDMYGKNRRMGMVERVFGSISFKDVAIWTSLLNGHLLNGDIDTAREVFDEMPQRNIVSWTAMIVGYMRKSRPIDAMELFLIMQHQQHHHPRDLTPVTVVALLSACADVGALNLGRSIHAYINKRKGFCLNVVINNGLIDMYAKSGNLEPATKVFYSMSVKDLFSWTSMISGLALNGQGRHALKVFDTMLESNILPNEITFLSILSACSHSGLVIEGEQLFKKFVHEHGLVARIEHYGCMVDLFVRSGHLEKALELIEKMPMKPDAMIWRSVLGACLERGDLELAEASGKKVVELEPGDDSVYVMLWRVYRLKNRWKDALEVMKRMKDQRIKKVPGCSWIEVDGIVHEFVAEACPHHRGVDSDFGITVNGIFEQLKLDTSDILFE